MNSKIHRRDWLRTTAAAGASLIVLRDSRSARGYFANEKLGVALVGLSGRGAWFVETIPRIGEDVVALCDVNQKRSAEAFQRFPTVPKFRDFRTMLDERGEQIDALFVATPDHTHAVISAAAMRAGKHVYCEKPLTHDVGEARALCEIAREQGVVTQMGNQGTATEAFRRAVELIQAGAIGAIQEIHVWDSGHSGPRQPPQGTQPVPEGFEWDLWLGPVAERPFHADWLQWHGWRDFATGNAGNWGPHSGNLPFKAMEIDALWHADPITKPQIRLHVEMSETERIGFPRWASIRYEIPARGNLPPIEFNHHYGAPEGRKRIEEHLGRRLDWGDAGERAWKEHGGCLVVGTEGMIKSTEHNSSFTLMPEAKFAGFEGPPQALPRSGSHEREFTAACKGGPKTMSTFDYAGPLVEFLLLANVATLFGHTLEFDPLACKVVNHPEADAALRREYRKGWSL
ncbi:MAG: Gfo/Idh/MocA family protein [Pirellulaceae bacterium]